MAGAYAAPHSICETVFMKNITVTVDEKTHRLARIRAAELDTSVSAMVRGYLRSLVAGNVETAGRASGKMDNEMPAERHARQLEEVFSDFDARGVGLRITDDISRDELYDEAINSKPDAVR